MRQGRLDEALEPLGRAATLLPEAPRFAYVFGVALHSSGETDQALEVLLGAHLRHPADVALLQALAAMSRDAGRTEEAAAYSEKLEVLTR